jgi:hypothetical protein
MQRASPGPDPPTQVAVSLSASLLIWSLPSGQVTETSFSPGEQVSSHLVSQAGAVSTCRAAVAAVPGGPTGPAGPAGPTPPDAPAGPGGPAGPAGPRRPWFPCGPGGPGGPAGPDAPCCPCEPSKHPVNIKPATNATTAMVKRISFSFCIFCIGTRRACAYLLLVDLSAYVSPVKRSPRNV